MCVCEQCQRLHCTCSARDNSCGHMVQLRHSSAMKRCLSPFHPHLPFFQDSHSCRIMPLFGEKKGRHPGLRPMGNLLAVRVSRSSDCWINGTIKALGVFLSSAKKLRADFPLTWSIPLHNVERTKKRYRRGMQENFMRSHCVPESH